jgi:hypothetical protein
LRRRWPIAVLAGAIAASAILLLYLGRGQTLIVDQWAYLSAYRSWDPSVLASPHNGHLIVLPLLVYKALFSVFGIESHLPYQLATVALAAAVSCLLFALIRDRVGDLLALAAAILMLFYGAGADTVLPTSQIPNLIGISSGLVMLLALRREDTGGDFAACTFLAMSLASFSIGVAFAAGAAVMLACRPAGQRLRRAWVMAIPLLAYACWAIWAQQFEQQTIDTHNLKALGSAVFDQIGAALAGLSGLFTTPNGSLQGTAAIRTDWAPALIVGLAATVIVRLRRPAPLAASALAAIAVLLVYLLLVGIALDEGRNTFDTRLVYLASVLTLLALGELCAPYRPGPTALAVAGCVFFISMCANVAELGDSAKLVREESAANRAKLAAVGIAGENVAVDFVVEEPPADMAFTLATLRELDAEFGSPAYSEVELSEATAAAREAADEELVRALRIAPRPVRWLAPRGAPPRLEVSDLSGGSVRGQGGCVSLRPEPGAKLKATIELPAGGVAYASSEEPVAVSLGRFADAPSVALPAREGSNLVRIPSDSSSTPWVARVEASEPALLCPVGRLT